MLELLLLWTDNLINYILKSLQNGLKWEVPEYLSQIIQRCTLLIEVLYISLFAPGLEEKGVLHMQGFGKMITHLVM